MEQLADETLRLIFSYLDNPDALSKVSKRLNEVSKDPYVRSEFFLCNHGRTHAFWAAFGRAGCLNADVINILHSSGAVLSRYLTQAVIGSYTRGQYFAPGPVSWAKGPKLSFPTFAHFVKLASTLYPNVDVTKGDDDGSIFSKWIRQSNGGGHPREKKVTWETIESMFKDNGFIPFAPGDSIMSAFPDALAADSRVLPLAKKNGLVFDDDFRDLVFRKVFSKTGTSLTDDAQRQIAITTAVKDLVDLDELLFVSRNVVGEVLMELDTRKPAFESLKVLDTEGHLRFDLGEVSRELIKTFRSTRSITSKGEMIRQLFRHFPTSDPVVREVVIVTVFLEDKDVETTQATLEALELLPLTERDVAGALSNPFSDAISDKIITLAADSSEDIDLNDLVFDSVARAIDNPSKGLYLHRVHKKLMEDHAEEDAELGIHTLKTCLAKKIRGKHTLDMSTLKPDPIKAGGPEDKYRTKTKLAYDYQRQWDPYHLRSGRYGTPIESDDESDSESEDGEHEDKKKPEAVNGPADAALQSTEPSTGDAEMAEAGPGPSTVAQAADKADVGGKVVQTTLTAKIVEERDKLWNARHRRRRRGFRFAIDRDSPDQRKRYPEKSLPVAAFLHGLFGPNDEISRIVLEHAVINGNAGHLTFAFAEGALVSTRHFKILAKLGRSPLACMWAALEYGEFLEEDFDDSPAEKKSDEKSSEEKKPEKKEQSSERPATPPPAVEPMDVDPVAPAALPVVNGSDATPTADAVAASPTVDPVAPSPAPSTAAASDAPSTSVAVSRPRRSTVTKRYEPDEVDDKTDDESDGRPATSSKKSKAKGKAKQVDVKGKGKEKAPVVDKKGKGKAVAVAVANKAAGPFEKERLKWIQFLYEMLKEEEDKLKARRKETKAAAKGQRAKPVNKTDFHRSIINHYPIHCQFDRYQRKVEGVVEIADYNKLFRATRTTAWQSDDDETEEEEMDETEVEDEDPVHPDELDGPQDEDEQLDDDEEVDQLAEDDDNAPSTSAVKPSNKRKRAPAKPKAQSTTTSKKKPKVVKTNGKTPTPKSKSRAKPKKKTPAKVATKPKPKPKTTNGQGKGKGKAVALPDDEDAKKDAHDAVFGKSDEELSEISDEEDRGDAVCEDGGGTDEMQAGPSGSGAKGADDSGVFVDEEIDELEDEE